MQPPRSSSTSICCSLGLFKRKSDAEGSAHACRCITPPRAGQHECPEQIAFSRLSRRIHSESRGVARPPLHGAKCTAVAPVRVSQVGVAVAVEDDALHSASEGRWMSVCMIWTQVHGAAFLRAGSTQCERVTAADGGCCFFTGSAWMPQGPTLSIPHGVLLLRSCRDASR